MSTTWQGLAGTQQMLTKILEFDLNSFDEKILLTFLDV